MKRLLLFLLLGFITSAELNAQVTAIDGMVEYQKGHNKRSSVIELPYPPETVENAIKESMAKKGHKAQTSKDVLVFRGVQLENDTELSDLHFKVERKSRKEKDISLVHLIVGRSSENVALRTPEDHHKAEGAKAFLTGIVPAVTSHHLELGIKEQDEVIKKAEKKLKNLQDDQRDYERKITNFQEKLAQNKKDQEEQNAELSKQRTVLDAMHSRRTPQ